VLNFSDRKKKKKRETRFFFVVGGCGICDMCKGVRKKGTCNSKREKVILLFISIKKMYGYLQ